MLVGFKVHRDLSTEQDPERVIVQWVGFLPFFRRLYANPIQWYSVERGKGNEESWSGQATERSEELNSNEGEVNQRNYGIKE